MLNVCGLNAADSRGRAATIAVGPDFIEQTFGPALISLRRHRCPARSSRSRSSCLTAMPLSVAMAIKIQRFLVLLRRRLCSSSGRRDAGVSGHQLRTQAPTMGGSEH
jgi:hypothetical protein